MKKRIIVTIAIIMCVVLSAFSLTACNNVKKLRKTGGTKDGSSINENTNPDEIVSQEVNKEEWDLAVGYFNGEKNFFNFGFSQGTTTTEEGAAVEQDENSISNISQKLTVNVNGSTSGSSVIIMKIDGTKIYLSIEQSGAYAMYNLAGKQEYYISFEKNENDDLIYKRYYKDSEGAWHYESASGQALLNQLKSAMAQSTTLYSEFVFENFSYDTDRNSYMSTVNVSGVPVKVEVKIVNGLPCYYRASASQLGETAEVISLFYDVGTTSVQLPEASAAY